MPRGWAWEVSDPGLLQAEEEVLEDGCLLTLYPQPGVTGTFSVAVGEDPAAEFGAVVTDWHIDENGRLTAQGVTVRGDQDTDSRICISEDRCSLTVTLPGFLGEPEVWHYVPDNSGLLLLTAAEFRQDLLDGAPGSYCFTLQCQPNGNWDGSARLVLSADTDGQERAVYTVTVHTDADGRIAEYHTRMVNGIPLG